MGRNDDRFSVLETHYDDHPAICSQEGQKSLVIFAAFEHPGVKDPHDIVDRHHDLAAEMHVHASRPLMRHRITSARASAGWTYPPLRRTTPDQYRAFASSASQVK